MDTKTKSIWVPQTTLVLPKSKRVMIEPNTRRILLLRKIVEGSQTLVLVDLKLIYPWFLSQ